jgi:hypothetical protein
MAPLEDEEKEGEENVRGGGQYGPFRTDKLATRNQETAVPWRKEEDMGNGIRILPILHKKQAIAEITKIEQSSTTEDILA